MPTDIKFSVEDLRTPERTEWVLRQFQTALQKMPATGGAPPMNIADLAGQIAPLVRTQLQAPGSAPLNLSALLPSTGSSVVIVGTHAQRLASYPASTAGAAFFETDRTALYITKSVGGALSWVFAAGGFGAVRTSHPADLGTNDAGFLFYITDYAHEAFWDGSAFRLTDGGGGYLQASAIALGTGYQLCDGTTTDYVLNNTTNLAVASFTTPDLHLNSNVYLQSQQSYTGVITIGAVPLFSGTPDNTGNDGGTPQTVQTGIGATVPAEPHTHPFTPHGTISLPSDPVTNIGAIYYFRR